MLIKKLDKFIYFNELVKEVLELMGKVPFSTSVGNQLALQVRDPQNITDNSWYESIGTIRQKNSLLIEDDYCHTHPKLFGGYIDKWLNHNSNYKIVRARLMLIPGRTCYSVHSDPKPRLHIPIITNEQCFICFPHKNYMQHLAADGSSYWVDTRQTHTAINCSQKDRIHLVGVVT